MLPDVLDGHIADATGLPNAMKHLSGIATLQVEAIPDASDAGYQRLNGRLTWVTNLRLEGFVVATAVVRRDCYGASIVAIPHCSLRRLIMCQLPISRREWLKLAALFSATGAAPFIPSQHARAASEPDALVRIGYLPITDATPLMVALNNSYFEAAGIPADKPVLLRSSGQLVESLLSCQANVVRAVFAPSPDATDRYLGGRAILRPDWHGKRIDFQSYPYPRNTEELMRRLKQTRVEVVRRSFQR